MITDSNQVCFVKIIGRRVQEEICTHSLAQAVKIDLGGKPTPFTFDWSRYGVHKKPKAQSF
jgi:hypothetical protein